MEKIPGPILVLGGTALTLGLFAVFGAFPPLLPHPWGVPCTDPMAQRLGLAIGLGLGLQLWAGARRRGLRWWLGAQAVLLVLVAWLGFYPISPLFSSGRIPILQGFVVITQARDALELPPGATITLTNGRPAAIRALTLTRNTPFARCYWMSTRGGTLDDPSACDTVYVPPSEEFDILKVSLEPGCGLPRAVGQLKISILP